jgi:hypothetical protein
MLRRLIAGYYSGRIRFRPYRDALLYLLLTAVFSLLPPIAGLYVLWFFKRWDSNWAGLLGSGDLLVASACLMASALWSLRRGGENPGFIRLISWGTAIIVIAFDCIAYAAVAIQSKGLTKSDINISPVALVASCVVLYVLSLIVGFYALVTDYRSYPSSQQVQNDQVKSLEKQLDTL